MGPVSSRSAESAEVVADRLAKSKLLSAKRAARTKALNDIVKRVTRQSHSDSPTFNIFLLSELAVFRIAQFLAPDLRLLLQVSPNWHFKFTEALDSAYSRIESKFALNHSDLVLFHSGKVAVESIRLTGQSGMRCDRVLTVEPLKQLIGHTIKLRCTYQFLRDRSEYKLEYKFDCVRKGARTVWLHKDETRDAHEASAASPQVPEICSSDRLEIALPWWNLHGLVDLDSVEWQLPLIQNTLAIRALTRRLPEHPQLPRHSINNTDDVEEMQKRLLRYDVFRRCETELAVSEWVEARYFTIQSEVYNYDLFQPFLRLLKAEFAGVDTIISKHIYLAIEPGIIPDSLAKLGKEVEVLPASAPLVNEVRRMGLLFDRHHSCEVRVGDSLILYISRGV
jgi:hypothetical protein